jgi:hypothetical protein
MGKVLDKPIMKFKIIKTLGWCQIGQKKSLEGLSGKENLPQKRNQTTTHDYGYGIHKKNYIYHN